MNKRSDDINLKREIDIKPVIKSITGRFLIIISFFLLSGCGEVYRLRGISEKYDCKGVSTVVESILWSAEQAAIRGERHITYRLISGIDVCEVSRKIKHIDRRFRVEKRTEDVPATLVISW